MNDNRIEIKEQQKDWFLKGFLILFLMTASIFVALLPLISTFAQIYSVYFYSIGSASFIVFTVLFVLLLYKECNPGVYMILSAHGFIDRKNVGENLEIEWTNVANVKILGKTDVPFLGISLENSDMIIAQMRKSEADEMRENINDNLPAILIAQNEIRITLEELKELFTKFVREARALEKDIPKKTKNNPFSTDDVLRAFGKLPKEDVEETVSEQNENVVQEEEDESATYPQPSITEEPIVTVDDDITSTENAPVDPQIDDPFYAALQKIASENIETSDASDDSDGDIIVDIPEIVTQTCDDDDMPEEIKLLLSKAKSSKISELGKMLNDSDTPFTYSTGTTPRNAVANESSIADNVDNENDVTNEGEAETEAPIQKIEFSFFNSEDDDKEEKVLDINLPETEEETLPDVEIEEVILNDIDTESSEKTVSEEAHDDILIGFFDQPVTNNDTATESSANEPMPFEITLDSMIENALKAEQEENNVEQELPSLEVPKIEMPHFNTDDTEETSTETKTKSKKKRNFVLHEKK